MSHLVLLRCPPVHVGTARPSFATKILRSTSLRRARLSISFNAALDDGRPADPEHPFLSRGICGGADDCGQVPGSMAKHKWIGGALGARCELDAPADVDRSSASRMQLKHRCVSPWPCARAQDTLSRVPWTGAVHGCPHTVAKDASSLAAGASVTVSAKMLVSAASSLSSSGRPRSTSSRSVPSGSLCLWSAAPMAQGNCRASWRSRVDKNTAKGSAK